MKIHFERSGGFAGMRIQTTFDTTELDEDERLSLYEMLASASFFELPVKISSGTGSRDEYSYRLTVEDVERSHSIEITDSAAPAEVQPLLRKLTMMARGQTD